MSKISKALAKAYANPLIVIQTMIALGLLVSGLYTMSWLYEPNATTPLGKAIDSAWIRTGIGGFYSLSAGMSLYSLKDEKYRSTSLFLMFLSYSFITLLRWMAIGFTPLTWVFTLTLTLILAFLYFRIRLLK